MKLTWIGLIMGILFYVLALVPNVLPHKGDVLFMILSGMLIASLSFFGFDLPQPNKKLSLSLLSIGTLILLGSILMALIGHPHILFFIAVPVLGLTLFGLRKLLDEKKGL